jgi:hypothetical protein
MGARNWLPNHAWNDCWEMVYIYYPDIDWEGDESLAQEESRWWYQDLNENIRAILPQSFWEEDRWQRGYRDTETVIAANDQLEVSVKDWLFYIAIQVYVPDDEIWEDRENSLRNLAAHNLYPTAKNFLMGWKKSATSSGSVTAPG